MSFSQVNESSPEDFATQKYFESISPLNKTAKFIYNVDTTRAFVVEGTPAPGDVLTYSSTAAGTWADPDKVGWVPIAPGGINSITAGTPGAASGASKLTIAAPGPGIVSLALANTAVTPGVYGGATTVPQITIDQQGQITSASSIAVSFPDQLASVPTESWGAATGRNLTGAVNGVCIGENSSIAGTTASIAIGHTTSCLFNNAIAIGANSQAGLRSTAINGFANTTTSISIGYLAASLANNAVTVGCAARTSGFANTFVGTLIGFDTITGGRNCLVGYNQVYGAGSILTTGAGNTFVGSDGVVTDAITSNSIGIGNGPTTTTNSIVIGTLSSCTLPATDGIAIGRAINVTAADGISIGRQSTSTATAGISIGSTASTVSANSLAIGPASSCTALATDGIAIGRQSVASADQQVSLGYLAGASFVAGAGCTLLGAQANANTAATNAVAVGAASFAGGTGSISIGAGSSTGTEGVSIGGFTTAARNTIGGALTLSQAANCTLMGYTQRCGAGATGTVLYGYINGRDLMTGTNNVGVGNNCFNNTITTGSNNVFLGNSVDVLANSTISSVGVGSTLVLSTSSVAIGQNLSAAGISSIVIGSASSTTAAATGSVVIGATTISEGSNNICIGSLAKNKMSQATVIGYNAGNNTNTASNNVIVGQSAGQSTSAAQNSIFGASADVSSSRSHCTVVGFTATASQNQCVVLGSSSSCTAINSNAFGYDVDNTTSNTTRIGSNKSADHVVDSEGAFRSVNQVHCVATGTGQVFAVVGPTKAVLTAEQSSYPAGLRDAVNNWIFLSAAGTECANRTYSLMTTIKAAASVTNNRWRVTMQLVEPGVGTREVAWGELCSSIANECGTSLCTVTKINGAITSRPYIYIELTRVAGAGTVDVNNIAESFHRIA